MYIMTKLRSGRDVEHFEPKKVTKAIKLTELADALPNVTRRIRLASSALTGLTATGATATAAKTDRRRVKKRTSAADRRLSAVQRYAKRNALTQFSKLSNALNLPADDEPEVSAVVVRAATPVISFAQSAATPVISLAKSALTGLTATGANKGGRRTRTKRRRHKKRGRSTKKR